MTADEVVKQKNELYFMSAFETILARRVYILHGNY